VFSLLLQPAEIIEKTGAIGFGWCLAMLSATRSSDACPMILEDSAATLRQMPTYGRVKYRHFI
jgi:hypothetical protein